MIENLPVYIHPCISNPFDPAGLDLIMISETADPPVVKVSIHAHTHPSVGWLIVEYVGRSRNRPPPTHTLAHPYPTTQTKNKHAHRLFHPQIIDYGKYKYSQEKKKKEQKKKAKTTEVKEVKMSYKIENHDYGVRMKQVRGGLWFGMMDGLYVIQKSDAHQTQRPAPPQSTRSSITYVHPHQNNPDDALPGGRGPGQGHDPVPRAGAAAHRPRCVLCLSQAPFARPSRRRHVRPPSPLAASRLNPAPQLTDQTY